MTTQFNRSWQNTTQQTYKGKSFRHWKKKKQFPTYFRGLSCWESSRFIVYQFFSLFIPFCTIYWTNLGLNTTIYETDHFRNRINDGKRYISLPAFREELRNPLNLLLHSFRGSLQVNWFSTEKHPCLLREELWGWTHVDILLAEERLVLS